MLYHCGKGRGVDEKREEMMTQIFNPRFAHEVIECVSEGRDPTVQELFRLAERIWQESAVERPAFAWGSVGTFRS